MYVSAQSDGSVQINRQVGGWEEFTVENRANNVVCLKSNHFLSAQSDGESGIEYYATGKSKPRTRIH